MKPESHVGTETGPTGPKATLSRRDDGFRPGDRVYHPKYGPGTVQALTRRDRIQPLDGPTGAGVNAEDTEACYDIALAEGGTLQVPISRADGVGLRCATNGIEAVKTSLHSGAADLPANHRERAAVLHIREQLPDSEALTHSIRDVLAQSRGRTLAAGERNWLDNACRRLSAEVAFVDQVTLSQARSAVWEIVIQMQTKSA